MNSSPKPVISVGPIPPAITKTPVVDKSGIKAHFSYSFKYFSQIQYFGLEGIEPSWFVSLLDKLKDFATNIPEELQRNYHLKDAWRYHEINWESEGIPIKRSDLNWLGPNVVNNNEEFPLWQFQVSTARGRIIGFWYEDVFNIVLLDPLHNLQPSKKFNYAVDDCYPLSNKYDSLVKDIEKVLETECSSGDACAVKHKLRTLPTRLNQTNAFIAYIDDDFLQQLNVILEKKSFSQLLEEVIISNISE